MSCKDCEAAMASGKVSYYRWKNANIQLAGCQMHLKEVIEALNKARR